MQLLNDIVSEITRVRAKAGEFTIVIHIINGFPIGGYTMPVGDRYPKFKHTCKKRKLFFRLNRLMRDYSNLFDEIRHQPLKLVTPFAGGAAASQYYFPVRRAAFTS